MSSDEYDDGDFDYDQIIQQVEKVESQRVIAPAAIANRILSTQLTKPYDPTTKLIPPISFKSAPLPRRAAPINSSARTWEKQPNVAANPFIHTNLPTAPARAPIAPNSAGPSNAVKAIKKVLPDNSAMLEIEEEELPSIFVNEGGNYTSDSIPVHSLVRRVQQQIIVPIEKQMETNGNEIEFADESRWGNSQWDELRVLRAEKLNFNKADEELSKAKKELKTKLGEINVIRSRAVKVEADHKSALEMERTAKKALEVALEDKVRENRAAVQSHSTQIAFQRHEAETSRRSGSQRPTSVRARSSTSTARRDNSRIFPTSAARSPSLGKARNIARPDNPPPPPAFGGFQNSFEQSTMLSNSPANRSESMPPPKIRKLQKTPEKGGNTTNHLGSAGTSVLSREKGKGRMIMEDLEEQVEEEDYIMDDADDGEAWDIEDARDWRVEILAAILKHTTFEHFDTESSTQVAPSQRTATASARASTSRLTFNGTVSTLGNRHEPDSVILDPLPAPTFYTLTNLRFPPSTPIKNIQEYSEICRELFITLGKRSELDEMNGSSFCAEIGTHLEGMVELLLESGLIGPLVSILSLISNLVLLFTGFNDFFLNSRAIPTTSAFVAKPTSKLLHLLSRIISIFGRPTPLPKNLTQKLRRKSRMNQRSIIQEIEISDERVELEVGKRDAIVSTAVDILSGLAWRLDEGGEESFIRFSESKDTMATLLDPNQPLQILTSVVQFLSLLASHKGMFRMLLGIRFYDSTDTKNSEVPILDRIGSLLISKAMTGSAAKLCQFQMALISLVSLLSTQHQDSIPLISKSPSLIPELLGTIFADVRTIWDQDGLPPSHDTLIRLVLVVSRLSASVHLFHYLTCSPTSTLKISEFCTLSQFVGLHDRFNIAFGTLSFGRSPDWVSSEIKKELVGLGYLALDIMEDVNPDEMEEMENCFLAVENEMEIDEEELARQLQH